jgi:hypothetical protein
MSFIIAVDPQPIDIATRKCILAFIGEKSLDIGLPADFKQELPREGISRSRNCVHRKCTVLSPGIQRAMSDQEEKLIGRRPTTNSLHGNSSCPD